LGKYIFNFVLNADNGEKSNGERLKIWKHVFNKNAKKFVTKYSDMCMSFSTLEILVERHR